VTIPPDRLLADLSAEAGPPRTNGELAFEAPWQARAFGLALAIGEQQAPAWEAFRERLPLAVATTDGADAPTAYYESWLASFEAMLLEQGMLSREEIEVRTAEFAAGAREET
jgi:nitrile hydratase accessory protein